MKKMLNKRIIILILDFLIAICIPFSVIRMEKSVSIDYCFSTILIVLFFIRIFYDFLVKTNEEIMYDQRIELNLQEDRHRIERLNAIHKRTQEAIANGNLDEARSLASLKEELN